MNRLGFLALGLVALAACESTLTTSPDDLQSEQAAASDALTALEPDVVVDIDVRPNSIGLTLNVRARGVVAVAILGQEGLVFEDIDFTSVRFGDPNDELFPDQVAQPIHDLTGEDALEDHIRDVDGDQFPDLVLHFVPAATQLDAGYRPACVVGTMKATPDVADPPSFAGCAVVRVIVAGRIR
ncbi:MAG: hypothetical protein JSU87_10435 [Gemmatimonadota bacterium]|nr:MAG: hypothetical protein JSU87_10435 [Gemmatimonadota bacterium]